ncbi:MAG: PQQ-binding-like beta-propeller repeat protein, partial [Bacteroidota bacterium]
GSFESTPIVYNGKIFIASRDGYLYCLGSKN